jgi:hypothetical protein
MVLLCFVAGLSSESSQQGSGGGFGGDHYTLVTKSKMPYSLSTYLHPSKGNAEIFPKEQYKLYYSLVLLTMCLWLSYLIIP